MQRKTPRFGPLARLGTAAAMTAGAAVAVTQVATDGDGSDTAASSTEFSDARERASENSSRSADRRADDATDLTDQVTNQQAEAAKAADAKERARAAQEEAERRAAEEAAARKRAEEEAARKAAEEEAARKKAEEEAARKAAEEEAREEAREEAAAQADRGEQEEAREWVAPLADYRITAGFGSPGQYWSSTHTGVDLAAPTGSEVRAVGAGTITDVGWDGPYGNKIELRHSDGTVTSYAHLSGTDVGVGSEVAPGDAIGRVGSTGNSTGPHLHLEVQPGGGDAVDPRGWLADHGVNL